MKTVGEILSKERKKRGLDIAGVVKATKIRAQFIKAIEENDFGKFSSVSTAHGFIKNYAQFLNIPAKFVLAVFRRDFCQDEKGKIILRGLVKPLDAPKVFRSSRIGFFLVTGLFIIGVFSYLFFQYFSLVRGPFIEIISPSGEKETFLSSVEVTGRTEPDATVAINGELIAVFPEGKFKSEINLLEGKNIIVIEATNKLSKTRRIVIDIFRLTSP